MHVIRVEKISMNKSFKIRGNNKNKIKCSRCARFYALFSSSDGFDLGHMKNRRRNEKTKNGCPFVASLLWIWHSLWLGGKSELFQFICLIMRTICSFCLCKLLIISIFIFKIEIFFHCEFLKKMKLYKRLF